MNPKIKAAYKTMPEPTSWYEDYAEGVISADEYLC